MTGLKSADWFVGSFVRSSFAGRPRQFRARASPVVVVARILARAACRRHRPPLSPPVRVSRRMGSGAQARPDSRAEPGRAESNRAEPTRDDSKARSSPPSPSCSLSDVSRVCVSARVTSCCACRAVAPRSRPPRGSALLLFGDVRDIARHPNCFFIGATKIT